MKIFGKKKHEDRKADEIERFSKELKDARILLNFAISEGIDVKDKIIEDINKTEELLCVSTCPEFNQRVVFEKAYRDLVKSLEFVTRGSLRISFLPLRFIFVTALIIFLIHIGIVFYFDFPRRGGIIVSIFDSLFVAFIVWFLDLFTGVVTKKRLIEIILFCYLFTIFALAGTIFFPFVLSCSPSLYGVMLEKSPIGIIKGCSKKLKNKDWISAELECDSEVAQWVINVGGVININCLLPKNQKKLDGGEKLAAGQICGGLVVPLYVVVLSLMGGAVSMTRRVPEYQKRVISPVNSNEHITMHRARELLVFQIMQVFSAPLIAITAYYILKPDTRTMSAALGFASGFASESILYAIRALVTKLKPT